MATDRTPRSGVGAGTGLALGGIASVQFGAAFAARLFGRIGPVGTVSLRMLGAALVLVALTRPWRRSWTRADLTASAVFGAVFTAMNVTLYLALDRLPLATVITVEFLGPLTVAIATARRWSLRAWSLPAAAGVVLLAGTVSAHDRLGLVFALLAACCWGGYILLSSRLGRSGTGLDGLGLALVFGAVVMLPVGLGTAGSALLHPGTVALGLGVGVLSSAIPYSLDLLALRRLPTAVFGVLTSLNPAVGALAGLVVLGQRLTARELVGVALVVVASVGVTVGAALARRAAADEPVAFDELPVPLDVVG